MGTRMAPSYANLFIMGKLEQSAIKRLFQTLRLVEVY